MTAMKLKRSNDRKVANAVSPNGKTPKIANTFGLPAGKAYSCPGATSICESVCYAGKLEKVTAAFVPVASPSVARVISFSPTDIRSISVVSLLILTVRATFPITKLKLPPLWPRCTILRG